MKKKILGALAALLIAGSASAFATGIGAQFGYNPSAEGNYGAALTFKLDGTPAVFAADVNIAHSELTSAGLTADYWVQNPRFAGMIHYYWGPGFNVSLGFKEPMWLNVGFRAVAGLNVFPIDFLEIYAQAAWQPHIHINFGGDTNTGDMFRFNCFPLNLGVRFWF